MSRFIDAALAFIFPPRCPGCRAAARDEGFCRHCAAKIEAVPWGHAPSLGFSIGEGEIIDTLVAPLYYGPEVRRAVLGLKFSGRAAYARPLGRLMAGAALRLTDNGRPDMVVFVPVGYKSGKKRGYNQAELLARRVGGAVGVPVIKRALSRTRRTTPQSGLSKEERLINLKGAFEASPKVEGKHVLLCDDVITTGATVLECAAALKTAGARRVDVVALALAVKAFKNF